MSDASSYIGLFLAIFLPWTLGIVWIRYLTVNSRAWNWPCVLGYGFFTGMFFISVVIRIYGYSGFRFSFYSITIIILFLTVLGYVLLRNRSNHTPNKATSSNDYHLPYWQKLIIATILVLITVRLGNVLFEIIWRPLFPWDAWMNWTPKAKVWYETGFLNPYISPDEWLVAGATEKYTLGNYRAWRYPNTIPLIQLWIAIGINSWNDSLINLPWLFCSIALGLSFYGQTRLLGLGLLPSFIGTYMIMNMPYINVHTALGGYADIWLATAFSLSAFSLAHYQITKNKSHLYSALIFAIMCSAIKLPGIVFSLIILAGMFFTIIRSKKLIAFILLSLSLLIIAVFFYGVEIDVPKIGYISITKDKISTSLYGQHSINYHPAWVPFRQSLFMLSNWNILFFIFGLTIIGSVMTTHRRDFRLLDVYIVPTITIVFYILLFTFTNYYAIALDQTTINRVLLYIVPYLVFLITIFTSKTYLWSFKSKKPNSD